MAYEVVMFYHFHRPSCFLGTFTEYPYLVLNFRRLFLVIFIITIIYSIIFYKSYNTSLWNIFSMSALTNRKIFK